MSEKKSKTLSMIDLSASVGFDVIAAEFKSLGQVEIVSFKRHDKSNKFRADISGQPGMYEYVVQGESRTYSVGADDCIKLVRAIGADGPVIADDIIGEFMTSKLFSVLKQAASRH